MLGEEPHTYNNNLCVGYSVPLFFQCVYKTLYVIGSNAAAGRVYFLYSVLGVSYCVHNVTTLVLGQPKTQIAMKWRCTQVV